MGHDLLLRRDTEDAGPLRVQIGHEVARVGLRRAHLHVDDRLKQDRVRLEGSRLQSLGPGQLEKLGGLHAVAAEVPDLATLLFGPMARGTAVTQS